MIAPIDSISATDPIKPERTLIDTLLEEQQLLTPVARFARKHEQGEVPSQERYYRDLIPLSQPDPAKGEQYSFEVDLDVCSGCKGCVTACHNLNGLEEQETWRDVGLLYGEKVEEKKNEPFQQTVTTACHHCAEPGCLEGCPVEAYEKDDQTGIVKHLDDQCIGCQYCILKCPYDVPKYSESKGIVRKCDMCTSRLEVGEAPACVQACPNEAIRIVVVDRKTIEKRARKEKSVVPGAFDSTYTLPSTHYKSEKNKKANVIPGNQFQLQPEPAHLPLVGMLVLTQLAVGLLGVSALIALFERIGGVDMSSLSFGLKLMVGLAFVIGFAGIQISILHLGKPLKAWRAFLGIGHSWLSREIVAFGVWMGITALAVGAVFSSDMATIKEVAFFSFVLEKWGALAGFLHLMAFGVGVISIYCSIMVYADTRRELWKFSRSASQFIGTCLLLGSGGSLLVFSLYWEMEYLSNLENSLPYLFYILVGVIGGVSLGKLVTSYSFLEYRKKEDWSADKRSALVMYKSLPKIVLIRFLFGGIGGIVLPLVLISVLYGYSLENDLLRNLFVWGCGLSFLMCFLGELAERYLFFRAVTAPKMPGGV